MTTLLDCVNDLLLLLIYCKYLASWAVNHACHSVSSHRGSYISHSPTKRYTTLTWLHEISHICHRRKGADTAWWAVPLADSLSSVGRYPAISQLAVGLREINLPQPTMPYNCPNWNRGWCIALSCHNFQIGYCKLFYLIHSPKCRETWPLLQYWSFGKQDQAGLSQLSHLLYAAILAPSKSIFCLTTVADVQSWNIADMENF